MQNSRLWEAEQQDLDFVFDCLRRLAHEVGEAAHFISSIEDVRRDAFGSRPHYEVLIGEWKGQAAGLATFFPIYSTYKGRPALYVDNLFVHDRARGARLGRHLMSGVCALAEARGCCRVELKVLSGNPAQHFYESLGMSVSDERHYRIEGASMMRLATHEG